MMAARLAASETTLGELLGSIAGDLATLPIGDLVLDSRDVRSGDAFVAVQGGREHGLGHAEEAVANGAAVVLYDPAAAVPWGAWRAPSSAPSLGVPGLDARLGELARKLYGPRIGRVDLAGITGTNGKSTVAYLVAQAATRLGAVCGYIGTLGYGVPPRLERHALTTPDVFTLHRELAALGRGHAAVEVSSHALAQDRIAGLELATAAFTNLSRDHLDEHGDFERYALAKARLFERPDLRRAVLNAADPFAARLSERLPAGAEAFRVRVLAPHAGAGAANGRVADLGSDEVPADVEAELEDRGLAGLALEISGRFGRARVESRLVGDFNAENLLVALGVLLAWDMPLAEACAALAAATAPPGRLEVLGGGPLAPTVAVDYAHTPDGLERVLRVLAKAGAGELWCVFGCGGDRDPGKRPLMGAVAAEWADHIVLTDDNPRREDPAVIVAGILSGIDAHASGSGRELTIEHDRHRAIVQTVRGARPGDVVLIAGKGHETEQLTGFERRPFSDREVALEALGAAA